MKWTKQGLGKKKSVPLWEWNKIHFSDLYVYHSYAYDVRDIYVYDVYGVYVYYAYVYGVYVYDVYGVYVPLFLFFGKAWVLETQLSFLYARKAL